MIIHRTAPCFRTLAIVIAAAVFSTSFYATALGQPAVCAGRVAPVRSFSQADIDRMVGPGRKLLVLHLGPTDSMLVISDENPNLDKDTMSMEIDIDPVRMSSGGWAKEIRVQNVCGSKKVGAIKAELATGPFIGVACLPLTVANNFRSDCTRTEKITISQKEVDEIVFIKPGVAGVWIDILILDKTFWRMFAGREVRFIWTED